MLCCAQHCEIPCVCECVAIKRAPDPARELLRLSRGHRKGGDRWYREGACRQDDLTTLVEDNMKRADETKRETTKAPHASLWLKTAF